MKKLYILILLAFFGLSGFSQIDTCYADFCYTAVPDTGTNTMIVTFQNNSMSTNPVQSYYWDYGDGNVDTITNPIHNYFIVDTFYVTLQVISQTACVGSFTDTVFIGTTCDSTFQFNPPLNFTGFLDYSYPPVFYGMDFDWDIPDTVGITPELLGYVIYQNNDSLDYIDLSITEYYYVLPDTIWYDTLSWYVTAIYENPIGESTPSNTVTIYDYPIGINNMEIEMKIDIFPNPTTGVISITNEGLQITDLEVFDIYGRNLQGFENLEGLTEIDLSQQPKGIYIIKLTTSKGVAIEKIVLE